MALRHSVLATTVLFALSGCGPGDQPQSTAGASPATTRRSAEGLASSSFEWTPPRDWQPVEVRTGSPRKAQFRIPGGPGIGDPGELVLYHFGPSSPDATEAKIEAWLGRFDSPTPPHRTRLGSTPRVTRIEVQGTYREPDFGAEPAATRPDTAMLLAVIHAEEGDYFAQAIGDRSTLEHWRDDWEQLLTSIRRRQASPPPESLEEGPDPR